MENKEMIKTINKKDKKESKKMNGLILIVIFLCVISFISFSGAYQLVCLSYGQSVPPSLNPPRYTCWKTSCMLCTDNDLYPTHLNYCNGLSACVTIGDSTIDPTPPELNVLSPIEGEFYSSTSVLFDITFDKPASIFYMDNNDQRRGFRRICSNCKDSYTNSIRLREGFNNITIRATDRHGNSMDVIRTFIIDTIRPRILRTEPRSGFTDGSFSVVFREQNPVELRLFYGVEGTILEQEVDLSESCYEERGDSYCNAKADISMFDGQKIDYWFEIVDIAGSIDFSRKISLDVDITPPKILDWDYNIDGRNLFLDVLIEEENLLEVGYSYTDDRGRFIERRICSRLNNDNRCQARISFGDGEYNINIYVLDKASQMVSLSISKFFIDSRVPRIVKTSPVRGFASGLFELEFDEQNPIRVTLYHNDNSHEISLESCTQDLRNPSRRSCLVEVQIDEFNGGKIDYYFEVEDVVGQKTRSRSYSLDVDTISPVILNGDSFWVQGDGGDNRNIYFDIHIEEDNFDRVEYIDYNDTRPVLRALCTRLVNNRCTIRRTFFRGDHNLELFVKDKAGNVVSLDGIKFSVV